MDKNGKFIDVFGKDITHLKIIEKILQLEKEQNQPPR
jgi:hypothetical protein